MKESDKIYLAGILDYTGAISMFRTSRRTFPLIRLWSQKQEKIELVAALLGVSVQSKRWFQVRLSGQPAVAIISELAPYIRLNVECIAEVLAWKQVDPKPVKVPCPKNCGNLMVRGHKTCAECWRESVRKKPERKNFLVDPPPLVRKSRLQPIFTSSGNGEVTTTPTGHIHRLR